MDDYAYTLVTDNPIVVDFSGCKHLDDLHERIRKSFGFPACCGKNWDAVWDCIDGYFDVNESRTIQIRGFQSTFSVPPAPVLVNTNTAVETPA